MNRCICTNLNMNANPYACMVIGNRKQCLDLTAHFVLDNWAFISLRAFRDFRGKPPWVEIHFDSTTVQVIKRRCLQACPLLCLLTVNLDRYIPCIPVIRLFLLSWMAMFDGQLSMLNIVRFDQRLRYFLL